MSDSVLPSPIVVYVYGVKPLYGGPTGAHFHEPQPGIIMLWEPHSFLHYWIDDRLRYHECVKATGEMPECRWVTQSKFKVELSGPGCYSIKST